MDRSIKLTSKGTTNYNSNNFPTTSNSNSLLLSVDLYGSPEKHILMKRLLGEIAEHRDKIPILFLDDELKKAVYDFFHTVSPAYEFHSDYRSALAWFQLDWTTD